MTAVPYNAGDIMVYANGESRRFSSEMDWSESTHKVLFFIPDIYLPCPNEFDSLKEMTGKFNSINCDVFLASSAQLPILRGFIDSHDALKEPNFKVISSYLLPVRMGVLVNGVTVSATAVITKDGNVAISQHLPGTMRSINDTFRMLHQYVSGTPCQ
jgi:alkyl hydroperoxide reductase subunit AhpC